MALLAVALDPQTELWQHLLRYVLPYAARDSFLLVAGVTICTGLLGTALAALVSFTSFKGRKILAAAAILPLAFPIYLHAYVYVELLDAAGPVQSALRELFGPGIYLPEVRSIWGAILIFSLVLYPYVYLPLTIAFSTQSSNYRDAARTLGCSPLGAFLRVQLPAARPALVAGLSLALMETLADFGASEYLGVRTFAYTIYSTWISRGSLAGAAQIAIVLIGIVALLIVAEAYSRRASLHHMRSSRSGLAARTKLGPRRSLAAIAFFIGVLSLAFFIPAGFLLYTALGSLAWPSPDFLAMFVTSGLLASVSAGIIVLLALAVALLQRWERRNSLWYTANAATIGYAMPGVVLALGALFAYGAIDNGLDAVFRAILGWGPGLLITGTPLILLLAYLSRFFAVGHGPIHSRLQQIPTNHDHVARTLGRPLGGVTREVLLPQLQQTLAAAFLLLAVDITKELPMTLLLRPIGIETLATSIYGHASRGQFEDGAFEALAILLCGVVAVLAMQRLIRQGSLKRL